MLGTIIHIRWSIVVDFSFRTQTTWVQILALARDACVWQDTKPFQIPILNLSDDGNNNTYKHLPNKN